MNSEAIARRLRHLLRDMTNELGVEFSRPFDEVAAYMTDRAAALSSIADDHAFDAAVRAARDDVVIFAGLKTDGPGDIQMAGAIQGALSVAGRAILPIGIP